MAGKTEDLSPWKKTDPILAAVLIKRFEAITNQMTNTLLRSGRSGVLNVARDFSCAILTADNRLVLCAENIPVHVVGAHLIGQTMTEFFGDDLAPGDAFIHNSPYHGNTHHADINILVPVFHQGQHLFTTIAKAHQADIGNAQPTTYAAYARDIYEEGALNFPCIRIQRNYKDIPDLIRMIKMRIRVPEQWYGDYLAQVGAARVGERALQELVREYGMETIQDFLEEWFRYGEQYMVNEIRKLPSGTWAGETTHDPVPGVADNGIAVKVKVIIDAENGYITVDLRDNVDCVPGGLNESMCCSINNAIIGVLNCLDPDLPHNAGAFSRIKVLLRENCVVGIPVFPTSCSVATTNVGDRIVNAVQSTFAQIGDGMGVAEGGVPMPPNFGVIAGYDRRNGRRFVNQLHLVLGGGPGTPDGDGWLTYGLPVNAGVLYKDSIELDEQKYPILVHRIGIVPDSGGAGKWDGAPGVVAEYGPRFDPMTVAYITDGHIFPPKGVRGGHPGGRADAYKVDRTGERVELPRVAVVTLHPGERIVGISSGGGGYGDPLDRDPERVRESAREGWISVEKARDVYGVVLDMATEEFRVDHEATEELRARLREARKSISA